MSSVKSSKAYLFHSDLGAVILTLSDVVNFDVEDVIKSRAISQARVIQFLNQAKKSSPNDTKGARTMSSVYTSSGEELPT